MKERIIRVAVGQINCTVGDLEGNAVKIKEAFRGAGLSQADIVLFPELALTGYPPEDLLLKPKFILDNLDCLNSLAKSLSGAIAVVGFVDCRGKDIYNAAAVICEGKVQGVYHKMLLPNYGVFDEKRYFTPGSEPVVFSLGNAVFGVNICEDIWDLNGPAHAQAARKAGLILNINASPYHIGKSRVRQDILSRQAKANKTAIVYANMVGGQDELVFDGQSMALDKQGRLINKAEAFTEDLLITDLKVPEKGKLGAKTIKLPSRPVAVEKTELFKREIKELPQTAEVYQALVLGLRDYAAKNGFKEAVIGLSGGIDSSLVAAIAADALGHNKVIGIFMPSRYSSRDSDEDARQLAQNLRIEFKSISIEQIYKMYLLLFEPYFTGLPKNIAEENLQARIRGNILMAFSNKFGWLVLTTGNKSEMSTGYATLYGDMAGGLALIKDVPKTMVYELVKYRNSQEAVIPERVISKAPTAELRMDQKDSDSLPEYEKLDPILKAYVEEDRDLKDIVSKGCDRETAKKVLELVDKSEYKRRQSPPGVKITPRAFGKDRRMPITNKYRK
ncbi:MAG: NAD+ synthase [Candidatus Omnitrophica bacterium]|jgi:NAD+ synthase (glutamine-hydrolysing)|nr:NAD+ synthase [Candidatus Omnitrophota bacterium]MDD5079546.1 NAD+ synthase [Candidatus Omnitrophota bacterium]